MSFTADKLIAIAAAEIGYKEKETNSQLDNPTANAGDGNYTKYARDLAAAGYYQASKQGYAWCDMFVDWCFLKLCGTREKAEEIICQTGVYGAGCTYSAQYYKNQGRFYTTDPQKGDQIFFRSFSHTGIIEKVENGKIYTIEGNSSDQVERNVFMIGSKSVEGFGRPKYDTVENSVESVENPSDGVQLNDIVTFTGTKHFVNANSLTPRACKPGKAKITIIKEGAKHPYHLIKVSGGGSTVYGWVNAEDIEELEKPEEKEKICPFCGAKLE